MFEEGTAPTFLLFFVPLQAFPSSSLLKMFEYPGLDPPPKYLFLILPLLTFLRMPFYFAALVLPSLKIYTSQKLLYLLQKVPFISSSAPGIFSVLPVA